MIKKILLSFVLFFSISQLLSQNNAWTVVQLIGSETNQFESTNRLIPEVYQAFLKMQEDALKQRIEIQIVSGYRSFERQKQIFFRKYNNYKKQGLSEIESLTKITEYSTIPGTSRHHWGTDIDIVQRVDNMPNNLLVESNFESEGPFCKMKEWLDQNAHKYGFYLVYTQNNERSGFKYEPWHYSYAPISKKCLHQFIAEDKKNNILPNIKALGVEIDPNFYEKYINTHVKGINSKLLIL